MSNGCVHGTGCDGLVDEASSLAKEVRFEDLLIVFTGSATPRCVAQASAFEDGAGIYRVAQLDTVVGVFETAQVVEGEPARAAAPACSTPSVPRWS